MAAVCDICGKKPSFGMNVSHSHRRTKRRWNPNIQRVRAAGRRRTQAAARLHLVHPGRQGDQAPAPELPAQRQQLNLGPAPLASAEPCAANPSRVSGIALAACAPVRRPATADGADCRDRLTRRAPRRRRTPVGHAVSVRSAPRLDGEQQLVVLAAAQGLVERSPRRPPGPSSSAEAHARGVGQAVQVERQAVGDVDHGVGPGRRATRALAQARHGPAVGRGRRLRRDPAAPRPRPQQAAARPPIRRTGPVTSDDVSRCRAPPAAPAAATGSDRPEHRHRHHQLAGAATRPRRRTGHPAAADASATPAITPRASSPSPEPPGHAQRHQRPDGRRTHGGQVAQRRPSAPSSPRRRGCRARGRRGPPRPRCRPRPRSGSSAGNPTTAASSRKPEGLDSVSQHASDTLQDLVFTGEAGHVPRFGGSHGTCLALDPTETGRTKEQIPPHGANEERETPGLGRRRWPP